jgi:hypothetical protein
MLYIKDMKSILPVLIFTILLTVAQARADDKIFAPTSSWLVGPVSAVQPDDLRGRAMPCVMMNQYDNGYTFRISGGGERILAMAVDFHQSAFAPGKSYRVDLTIPPHVDAVLPANAYNESILTMNTQKIDGLYKNLAAAKTMKMKIGDRTMEFALLGVKDGLQRMEQCFNGGAEAPETVAVSPAAPAVNPALMPPPPPMGMQTDAVSEPPMIPQDAIPEVPMEEPVSEMAQVQDSGAASMIDDMLRSAVEKSGQVKEPVPEEKTAAQPSVQQQGQALAQAWSPGVASGSQREIMVPRTDSRLKELAAQQSNTRTWRAMHGAGLQEVLDVWASQAHVGLVWKAGRDFPVVKSVSAQGTFEEAVSGLLGQYEAGKERPVGKIYNDPVSGKRVLLVETASE